jgi:hypothetical protein
MGCDTMWSHGQMPTFRRNIVNPSSALKMETVYFSEMLVYSVLKRETLYFSEMFVSTYVSIWHHNPEQLH